MPTVQEYKEVVYAGGVNRNVTFREVSYYCITSTLSDDPNGCSSFEEARANSLTQFILKLECGTSTFENPWNPYTQAFKRFTLYDLDQNPIKMVKCGEWDLRFHIVFDTQILNIQYYVHHNGERKTWTWLPCTIESFMIGFRKFQELSGCEMRSAVGIIDIEAYKSEINLLKAEISKLKASLKQIKELSSY